MADYAVDGIVSSFHSLRTTNQAGTNPVWIEVAYPLPITIASAHVYSGLLESDSTSQVLASLRYQFHNGSSWIDIPGTTISTNTQPEVAVVFSNPVTATRFRLFSTNAGNRTIRELAFFPPNVISNVEQGYPLGTDVNLNLAYQRPATPSSAQQVNTNGPGYAKNAFDGYLDNRSRWLVQPTNISGTNVYLSGEILEVDLLTNNLVGSAHVHSGIMNVTNRVNSSPIPNFELQYLSGTNWLVIPGSSITNNTNSGLVIPFTTNVATTRVRLVTTSGTPARLQELLLFPPRTNGYPLGQEVINAAPPTNTWERFSDSFYRIRNTGPDLRIGLVSNAVVNVPADANFPERTEWQLLLNHRDGSYRLRNAESGLCLALSNISTTNDTPVTAQEYTGLPHQDWRLVFTNATNANFALVNIYSGLALQPAGSSWSAGTPLVVRSNTTTNVTQYWNTSLRRHYPKKGIAATTSLIRNGDPPFLTNNTTMHMFQYSNLVGSSWSYTWGRQLSSNFPYISEHHAFSPMQWGNGPWSNSPTSTNAPMDRNHRDLQSNPKPMYLLGFNEPEKTGQGTTSVDDAIMRWPRLEARDVPLVGPCPADPSGPWQDEFVARADELGYRRDYTPVHSYRGPYASQLINVLGAIYTNYGRPIWLTEFAVVAWSPGNWTEKDNFDFLAEFMWRAESLTWLKRYSLFVFNEGSTNNPNPDPPESPRSDALNADGSLTPFGQLYAGWDGVTNVVTNRAYHLHAFGAYRRGHNPGGTSAPTAVSPSNSVAGIQWTLLPATTTTNTNTFRIVSTLDGRPLRTTNGTNVSFGTNGETGAAVEWRLVADQYGLHYIQHPASANRRLQLASNSTTLTLVASNNTNDISEWRFVRPAVSEVASLPAAPTGLTATGGVASIALSWGVSGDADGYNVERLDNILQTWTNLAPGITQTAWTNTGLPGGTTWSYRIIATNAVGSSLPSSVAAATTTHPLASLPAWQAEFLAALPPEQRGNLADPDADGILNLREYAFVSDPLKGGPSPFKMMPMASGNIIIQFPWNWRASDVMWRVRQGTNLTNQNAWPLATPASVSTNRIGDVDVLNLTFPITTPSQFFILDVVGPP